MSHIIAGDPAPTNPVTALDDLVAVFDAAGLNAANAHVIARGFLSRHRAEVLAEAIEAARSEFLTDNTGTAEDEAYNQGVADAVAAVDWILQGGAR